MSPSNDVLSVLAWIRGRDESAGCERHAWSKGSMKPNPELTAHLEGREGLGVVAFVLVGGLVAENAKRIELRSANLLKLIWNAEGAFPRTCAGFGLEPFGRSALQLPSTYARRQREKGEKTAGNTVKPGHTRLMIRNTLFL